MSFHRQDYLDAATRLGDWLKAHPTLVIPIATFIAGYVLAKLT